MKQNWKICSQGNRQDRPTWVYLMTAKDRTTFKVGRTTNLKKRIKEHRQQRGKALDLIVAIQAPNHRAAVDCEWALRKTLGPGIGRTEWYPWRDSCEGEFMLFTSFYVKQIGATLVDEREGA